MTTGTERTVKQWLEELATGESSTQEDEAKLSNLLHQYGFPGAVITCGIVYLEGHGTIEAPPMPIQTIATMILTKAR